MVAVYHYRYNGCIYIVPLFDLLQPLIMSHHAAQST